MKQPTQCPRCDYIRNDGDALVLKSICPSCGVVYARHDARHQVIERERSPSRINDFTHQVQQQSNHSIAWNSLVEILLPSPMPSITVPRCAAHAVIYLGIFTWGWHFILAGISIEPIMGSFMHLINLPFHEFGHVIFRPFGQFMTILGGSLFQILVPLGLTVVFLFNQHDPFAASVTAWWSGQSFIDLSPYIADASFRSLPLIAGLSEASHDWGNLLTQLGWLQHDYTLARACFLIGTALIIMSLAWGGLVLTKQLKSCMSN